MGEAEGDEKVKSKNKVSTLDCNLEGRYDMTWASWVVLVVKDPPANAGDKGSIPGWGLRFHMLHCVAKKKIKF